MKKQHYYIYKKNEIKSIVCLDYDKISGYKFMPRNNVKYDGIKVNKVVVINPSMIEKVLRRKIKNKLDLYLNLIMRFIDSEDSDSDSALREALDDLSKYKSIVMHKYRKYLDEKYTKLLLKKIAVLEYELEKKMLTKENTYDDTYEEEIHRRR